MVDGQLVVFSKNRSDAIVLQVLEGYLLGISLNKVILREKGYNPVNQIVGYIMSGDPTYITSHKGARSLIMKVERDEILEELMAVYIDARLK